MAGIEPEQIVEESIENTQTESVEIETASSDKSDKLIKLPLSRIKHIIKQDPDVNLASHDAVVMIAKATVSNIRIDSASLSWVINKPNQHFEYVCVKKLSLLPFRDNLFIYLGFYVAFNTVQVISRRVVGRAEKTST